MQQQQERSLQNFGKMSGMRPARKGTWRTSFVTCRRKSSLYECVLLELLGACACAALLCASVCIDAGSVSRLGDRIFWFEHNEVYGMSLRCLRNESFSQSGVYCRQRSQGPRWLRPMRLWATPVASTTVHQLPSAAHVLQAYPLAAQLCQQPMPQQ